MMYDCSIQQVLNSSTYFYFLWNPLHKFRTSGLSWCIIGTQSTGGGRAPANCSARLVAGYSQS